MRIYKLLGQYYALSRFTTDKAYAFIGTGSTALEAIKDCILNYKLRRKGRASNILFSK